ncbi:MAG: hypothetical protein A2W22_04715 [Candidatus Levybacteria bacterium RBG_16_35_11]|nr:MAG: hypothetical protein A2W22_04715 [Candidatus Levybacteria bacterium RBG_16_35_11]
MRKEALEVKDSEFAVTEKPVVVFEGKPSKPGELSWKNPDYRDQLIEEYRNPWLAKHSWEREFSDSLPEDDYETWSVWYKAQDGIRKAKKEKTLLSSSLVAASVFHFHHAVAREIGLSQALTEDQLEFLMQRPDLRDNDKILISFFQQGKIPQGNQV